MSATSPLRPPDLERLIPLLRHLAELIGQGTEADGTTRAALCLGAGIDDTDLQWADPELRRWAAILGAAHHGESAAGQDLGVRALTLRGIPQATARAAVADAAASLEESQTIWVSSHTIAAGDCPLDTPGTAEVVVRGGPGTVTPGSDSITVEPVSFGPEETTLHIRLDPAPAGSMTWSTIALETTTDRLVLDVTARWCEAPPIGQGGRKSQADDHAPQLVSTFEPATPPPAVLVVAPTGPADHRSISAAITAAPPNARILVQPGRYSEGLVLDKPLEILGDGPSGEIVVEATTANCLLMKTDYAHVRGIAFHGWAGTTQREFFAVDAAQGCLTLADCDITSDSLTCVAIHGPETTAVIRDCRIHDGKKAGIFVYEHGRGTIENCDIHTNALAGVVVKSGGDPTVRGCRIHDSKQSGVYVFEQGRGTITDCDIHANALDGITVESGGDPTVQDCRIHDGKEAGIYVNEQGRGTITDCDIHANALAGVLIESGGDPTVQDCRIHDGKNGGIYVEEQGRGTIENCDIHSNAFAGVVVKSGGDPTVQDCRIHDGKEAGIYVNEQGRGTITDCDIHANALAGIAIASGGDPTVRGCRIHDGKSGGIYVYEQGRGTITVCDIHANAHAGITVASGGDPTVRGCRIHDGKSNGVYVYEQGRGTITDCDIHANAYAGVHVNGGKSVTLRRNRINGNGQKAIWVQDNSGLEVEDNDLTENTGGPWDIDSTSRPNVRAHRNRE